MDRAVNDAVRVQHHIAVAPKMQDHGFGELDGLSDGRRVCMGERSVGVKIQDVSTGTNPGKGIPQ